MLDFFKKHRLNKTTKIRSNFKIPEWAHEIEDSYFDIVRIYKNFVVFLDHRLEIDWITSDEYDSKINDSKNGWVDINLIASHIRLIYVEIPEYTTQEKKKHISLHLGEALVAALHNNNILANNIIQDVKTSVAESSAQDIRKQVLAACSICIACALIGLTTIEINNYLQSNNFLIYYRKYTICFFVATLGTIVSIFLKSTNIADNQRVNDKYALRLEVYFKILSGSIFGCIALELSKAGMIPVNTENNSAIYIFSFISGFAERFIPDILTKQTASTPEK